MWLPPLKTVEGGNLKLIQQLKETTIMIMPGNFSLCNGWEYVLRSQI